jgi:16S rRNA (guanine(1405)-N(7))-methyltransferase
VRRHDEQSALDHLVNNVLESKKYRGVNASVVRSIGQRELSRRATLKEAIKATRNKLHQVGSAYLPDHVNYTAWLAELEQITRGGDAAELRSACQRMMGSHASTRERLPILEQFYRTILVDLAPVHTILDVACGLNPLALPWMPLETDVRYYACDIYQDMVDFLDRFMTLTGVYGKAYTRDACNPALPLADSPVDVALVLKAIPCLEQIDKQAGTRLLQSIEAKYIVASFPIYSLGGHHKGMAKHYEEHFRAMINGHPWTVTKFVFATELVFIVEKGRNERADRSSP